MADSRRMIGIMVISLILCIGVFVIVFMMLNDRYQNDNAYSSASHLIEINKQGKNSINSYLREERNLAINLGREIESGTYNRNTLMKALKYDKRIWKQKEIYIYTADGSRINNEGRREADNDASERAAATIKNGRDFNIVGSELEYAVSVDTGLKLNGSRVVVISAVVDLSDLLDRIGFAPFGGQGSIYLTRQSGVTICSSGTGTREAYNVQSLFNDGRLNNLKQERRGLKSVMDAGREGEFLYSTSDSESSYVIVTPIRYSGENFYLVSTMPQSVVNYAANDFTRYLVMLFILTIVLIAALSIWFLILFVRKTKKYREDVASRERLLDLLVSKTDNVFMLLEAGVDKPVYITSNSENMLGRLRFKIEHKNGCYRIGSVRGGYDKTIEAINSELKDWDGEGVFNSEYIPYGAEGLEKYLRISIYNAGEDKNEFIGIVQDATKEYRRERGLKDALDLADSANRAKSKFLSSVSHDIRTPLNAIINTAKFLENDIDDAEKARAEIDVIQKSSLHLLGLINDVLDLSRIESGKISFISESFNMNEELDKVCGIIEKLCEAKRQTFVQSRSVFSDMSLTGDPVRLNQILINILNNAMKFTPEGGRIEFAVSELESISRDAVPFKFVIRDNGIGIAGEMIDKIFDPFSRSASDVVRKTEGSGLGLAITKSFVEALGGSIGVVSEIGLGTEFTVGLTYFRDESHKPETAAAACEAGEESFSGKVALLADDNDINLSIARTILNRWGMAVECAADGRQALDMFMASAEGHYDIVYLDIQMPEMDGYEVARAIRGADRADAAVVPLVAMTANAFAEDVERARAAGMDMHVSKPIDVNALFNVTAGLMSEVER